MHKYIYTSDKNSSQMAFNEIKEIIPGSKLLGFISPGIGIVETESSFIETAKTLLNSNAAFIRHICPVDIVLNTDSPENLVENIFIYCKKNLPLQGTFSIQTRLYTKKVTVYKKNFINETCADKLSAIGFSLDIKNPLYTVSVIIADNAGYVGISETKYNISPWAGGAIRFKKQKDFVSRAEFKLLEAFEVYKISLPPKGYALDLGAAPGGWTKVLAEKGFYVTAVDPANLNEDVLNYPGVSHFKGTAQDFLQFGGNYDIIVNDMKMDALESIAIMIQAKNNLNKNGIIIMTLKLKQTHTQRQFNKAFKILNKEFGILGVRQLFHNRTEVTAVLRRLN